MTIPVSAGCEESICIRNISPSSDRSLGDFEYKQLTELHATQQLVSPEPEVYVLERDKLKDQLLIIACDGVWDVFENIALASYVLQRLRCVSDLADVCSELLDTSLHKVSMLQKCEHFLAYCSKNVLMHVDGQKRSRDL